MRPSPLWVHDRSMPYPAAGIHHQLHLIGEEHLPLMMTSSLALTVVRPRTILVHRSPSLATARFRLSSSSHDQSEALAMDLRSRITDLVGDMTLVLLSARLYQMPRTSLANQVGSWAVKYTSLQWDILPNLLRKKRGPRQNPNQRDQTASLLTDLQSDPHNIETLFRSSAT